MTFEQGRDPADPVMENIRGTYDALNVRRVFGDPYQADGVTVIPVARVAGGAGGGGGQGVHEGDTGRGFGTGFGVQARPVGVYEVRGSNVVWKPAVDVNRLARGGQVLGGIAIVCATLLLLRRQR